MRPFLIASAVLLASGAACLILAPRAVVCMSGSDYTACETVGTIVLNVVGALQLAAGVALLLLGRKATT